MEWQKGNCAFYGSNILGWGRVDYSVFTIGEPPSNPFYETNVEFSIKLPDGKILKSTEFTYENILKIEGIDDVGWRSPPGIPNVKTYYAYRISSTLPGPCCCMFGFDDTTKKLVYFKGVGYYTSLSRDDEDELIVKSLWVGSIKGDKFYQLPMTQEQIEDIFGKPDDVIIRWRP